MNNRLTDLNNAAHRIVNICENATTPEELNKITRILIKLLRCIENQTDDTDHQAETERKRLSNRVGTFDYKNSEAFADFKKRNLHLRSQKELVSIAQVIGEKYEIVLDREAKRRKKILYKWFQENLDIVKHALDFDIQLITEE